MLSLPIKYGGVQHSEVRHLKIGCDKFASTYRWNMEQFDKRHQICMLWAKTDARKTAMVELSITRIFWQQEWVVHIVFSPKCDSIVVVLANFRED